MGMLCPMPCCMYIESTTIAAFYAYALTLCYTVSRLFKAVALRVGTMQQQTALVGLEHPLKTPRLQSSRSVRSIFFFSVFGCGASILDVQGVPAQYDPRYSTILNRTKKYEFPDIVRFFAFFSQKTAFLKVHFMYLVLVLAQYDFSIVRFPGSPKFVLSGDPLYSE